MTTSSELFASLEPGQFVDLAGETITANDVAHVPDDVTIRGAAFVGQMHLTDAQRLTFDVCSFTADPATTFQSLCKFLGGHGFHVIGCTFRGGKVASQLGVGLNTHERGDRAVPTDWLIDRCRFEPLAGQWGTYPQGHNIYVLTDPTVPMGGRIERCILMGSPFGAALKLGGTGNDPHREGITGVVVSECEITGVHDGAGRALAVLTQGARTDVELDGCTLRCTTGTRPWVQAMDGATCRMVDTRLPDGWVNHATWYVWRILKRETKTAHAGGARGGVEWT